MAEDYGIYSYNIQELDEGLIELLDNDSIRYVKKALKYMDLNSSLIDHNAQERKGYILTLLPVEESESDSKGVKVLITFLKLQETSYVMVSKALFENIEGEIENRYSIELNKISTSEIGKVKTAVTFDDGVRIGEYQSQTDDDTISLPDLLKEEIAVNGGIRIQALPCIQSGCCTFSGVKYKWCGAGCGSGTPVNSLDTCCRTHDYCYGSFKSYPDRCSCDRNLRSCAANTSDPGKTSIRAAFWAKMLAQGC
ncbi:hypothetical protein [Oceanobacillus sp. FSL H7-0719]|uniref:hypothetical protein n=1 Tax=Oceanobacillus sp. FSL H7-0719 TaxID=2954507 RepID=UPI0032520C23